MSHLHALLLRISTLCSLKSFFDLPSNDLSQHGRIFLSVARLQVFPSLPLGILCWTCFTSLLVDSSLSLPRRFLCNPLAGSTMATGYLAVHFYVSFYFFPSLPRDCAHYMCCFLALYTVYTYQRPYTCVPDVDLRSSPCT